MCSDRATGGRIASLEHENEALRQQIMELRRGVNVQMSDLGPGPPEWGLTPVQRRLVLLLASREVASHEFIEETLDSRRQCVRVHLCRIRKKLAPFGVEIRTIWGIGISLDSETRAFLKRADQGEKIADPAPASH
jgi:two-component system, cell cycle response regulator CtrA